VVGEASEESLESACSSGMESSPLAPEELARLLLDEL
jgi:hypothetical protein